MADGQLGPCSPTAHAVPPCGHTDLSRGVAPLVQTLLEAVVAVRDDQLRSLQREAQQKQQLNLGSGPTQHPQLHPGFPATACQPHAAAAGSKAEGRAANDQGQGQGHTHADTMAHAVTHTAAGQVADSALSQQWAVSLVGSWQLEAPALDQPLPPLK